MARLSHARLVETVFNRDDMEAIYAIGEYWKYEQRRINRVLAKATQEPALKNLLADLGERMSKIVYLNEYKLVQLDALDDERAIAEMERQVDIWMAASYRAIDRHITAMSLLLEETPKPSVTRRKKKRTPKVQPRRHDARFLQQLLATALNA